MYFCKLKACKKIKPKQLVQKPLPQNNNYLKETRVSTTRPNKEQMFLFNDIPF